MKNQIQKLIKVKIAKILIKKKIEKVKIAKMLIKMKIKKVIKLII